jgi:hypothetical protein
MGKLTRLYARAGFGKTTLLAEWLAKLRMENEALRKPDQGDVSQFSILNAQFKVAWVSLERALMLAEPEGYVRTFVDEGAPMAALLTQIAESDSPVATYAARLLAAFPERLETGGLPMPYQPPISSLQPQCWSCHLANVSWMCCA